MNNIHLITYRSEASTFYDAIILRLLKLLIEPEGNEPWSQTSLASRNLQMPNDCSLLHKTATASVRGPLSFIALIPGVQFHLGEVARRGSSCILCIYLLVNCIYIYNMFSNISI